MRGDSKLMLYLLNMSSDLGWNCLVGDEFFYRFCAIHIEKFKTNVSA